jgi:F0F1-type ATP synthase assembly protein I
MPAHDDPDDQASPGTRMDADGNGMPDADWVRGQRKQVNAAGAGLQFGAAIVVFALAGNWADGRFGTKPWLLLVGVGLGFLGGTISLLKKFK